MRRLFAFVFVLLVLASCSLADDSAAGAFSGHWKGTIGTKTGSGPFEMTLTKRGNTWNGEATMGGLDGNMHPGPLKDIQIAGESLRCTFEPSSDISAVPQRQASRRQALRHVRWIQQRTESHRGHMGRHSRKEAEREG